MCELKFPLGLTVSLALLFLLQMTNAQDLSVETTKALRVTSQSASLLTQLDNSRDLPLLNSASEIVGSYRPEVVNAQQKFRVTTASGASLLVAPLQLVLIAKNESRVIAYGDHFEMCTFANLFIKMYSLSGELLKEFDSDLHWPYAVALSTAGDFYAAGKKGLTGLNFVLVKYSRDGDLVWEKSIPPESPMRLVLSPSQRYSSLVQYNEDQRTRSLAIFSDEGDRIYRQELQKPLSEMEFVTDDKLVVYSGNTWMLYQIDNDVTLLSQGRMPGNPLGNHPITASSDGERFAIVTSVDQDEGYHLQVYNSSDGRFIAENYYGGLPHWQPYRIARMIDSQKIELLAEDQLVTFTLE